MAKIVLSLFVHPPVERKSQAWAIVGVMTAVIGVADYFSGIEVSLAVFYLVPISLATGWLGPRVGIWLIFLSAAIRLVSDWLIVYPAFLPPHAVWNMVATSVITVFVVWLLHSLIVLHRQLEQKVAERTHALAESVAELERLQHELLEVGARERNAIGRELHDELGQHLVATAMAAQVLARGLEGSAAAGAQSIVRWIEEAIAKGRKLARGLLLASIAPDRFSQELEELAVATNQAGVRCRVSHPGGEVPADAAECAQLFRIAQEAVSNALRHARARAVDISLVREADALCLTIEDDGEGFSPVRGTAATGMGLPIMEHRAKVIGASLSWLSKPGEGTKVVCRLPLRANPSA